MNTPSDEVPDGGDELVGLINTLHRTGRRIEALTDGQVDAVSDRYGRPFLLRAAQEQIRRGDVAIFDAVPAMIAVLDSKGMILSVNAGWRNAGIENGMTNDASCVGENYLDICDIDQDSGEFAGADLASEIRAVLDGSKRSFSIEYPCPTPEGMTWFLMTVNPISANSKHGAIVMHIDISQRKSSEHALLRYGAAMDAIADAIYMIDRASMRCIHVNAAACSLHGLTSAEMLDSDPWTLLDVSRSELEDAYDELIVFGQTHVPIELERTRSDGTRIWLELRRNAQRSGDGWTIISLVRDITERKQRDVKIKRLSRVHAMMSSINALMLRVTNREALYEEACRIAVQIGGFRTAWIGAIDPDSGDSRMLAWNGVKPGFAEHMAIAHAGASQEPAAQVYACPCTCNDVETETRFAVLRDDLLAHGVLSFGCFPLIVRGRTESIMALYAGEKNVFDAEETHLLAELMRDLAFCMGHIDSEQRLHYLASFDELTGLANRTLFLERLGDATRSSATTGQRVAVAVLDLARFSSLNESLGREAGDLLLTQVAHWLQSAIGGSRLTARVGPDVFSIALLGVGSDREVGRTLAAELAAFRLHDFIIDGAPFRVAARIGVTTYPDDGIDAVALLRNAESALEKAKFGNDEVVFYEQKMSDAVALRLTMENRLRHALEHGQFVLHYQPKFSLTTGTLTGTEALLRWNDPRHGLVQPGEFIPILEETGMILDVGRWVMSRAMADYLTWRSDGLDPACIAVNVSPLQLRHAAFVADVRDAMGAITEDKSFLELEITESLVMEDVQRTMDTLKALREIGVRVAIDDFGTGFSSLSYLSRLQVDTLKIDRAFIIDMTLAAHNLSLVSTIINLGHSLTLNVIAEGVETEEQVRLLRLLRCDEFQGYLVGAAVPAAEFAEKFLAHPRIPATHR